MTTEELVQAVQSRVSIGLATSLFFEQCQDDSLPNIPWIFEDYAAAVGNRLTWWVDDDRGRPARVTERQLAYPRTRLSVPLSNRSVSWSVHAGKDPKDASPTSFYATLRARKSDIGNDGDLHGLFASVEPAELPVDAATLLARTLSWTRRVKVTHGNAGFAFVRSAWSSEANASKPYVFAASKRYRGIDVLDTGGTASRCKDGIKCVNWLTIVQNAWLDRLGGLDAVRAKLSSAIKVHEILDGALFQAGSLPLVGDINVGEDLSAYHEIGRVLRPIRSKNHGAFGSLRDFSMEESQKWLARFDE
jgi:Protein of unknown function (DUF3396)